MVWGGKVPSLEVFWEGVSGEGWNERRDGSPVLALRVGEQAFLWGGGSPGMGMVSLGMDKPLRLDCRRVGGEQFLGKGAV